MNITKFISMIGGNTKISIEDVIYETVHWSGVVDEWLNEKDKIVDAEIHSMTVVNGTDVLRIYIDISENEI